MNENTRPIIENNTCATSDGITIYKCKLQDNGNIIGYTSENKKALYCYEKNTWFFGSDIGRNTNLVSLKDRTEQERKEIVSKAHQKARENRQEQYNFNQIAKAMLKQTMTEEQIALILGDKAENVLIDKSVGAVLLGAMLKGALEGSYHCAEFVRDSAGFKPKNEVEVSADIMTDADRELIEKVSKRIEKTG